MEHVIPTNTNQQHRPLKDGTNMRKLLIGVTLLVFGMGVAQAQEGQRKTPQERAEMRTEHMTKELGLNAEQAEKVKAINMRYAEKNEAMRAEHKAKAEANRGKGAEQHDARMEEYKQVLTPEQYDKMVANQAAMKEKRQEMRGTKKDDMKQKNMEKRQEMRGTKGN